MVNNLNNNKSKDKKKPVVIEKKKPPINKPKPKPKPISVSKPKTIKIVASKLKRKNQSSKNYLHQNENNVYKVAQSENDNKQITTLNNENMLSHDTTWIKSIDKIFIINLERRTDRKMFMMAKLEKAKLSQYIDDKIIFYNAVDGNQHTSSYHSFVGKLKSNFQVSSLGAYGILLTYQKLLNFAKGKHYKKIMIFEDDIYFHQNFHHMMNLLVKNETFKTSNLLYLGANQSAWNRKQITHIAKISNHNGNSLVTYPLSHSYRHITYGAYGIVIDQDFITNLLHKLNNLNKQSVIRTLDSTFFHIVKKNSLKSSVVYPNIIIPEVRDSDNIGPRNLSKMAQMRKWILKYYLQLGEYNKYKYLDIQSKIKNTVVPILWGDNTYTTNELFSKKQTEFCVIIDATDNACVSDIKLTISSFKSVEQYTNLRFILISKDEINTDLDEYFENKTLNPKIYPKYNFFNLNTGKQPYKFIVRYMGYILAKPMEVVMFVEPGMKLCDIELFEKLDKLYRQDKHSAVITTSLSNQSAITSLKTIRASYGIRYLNLLSLYCIGENTFADIWIEFKKAHISKTLDNSFTHDKPNVYIIGQECNLLSYPSGMLEFEVGTCNPYPSDGFVLSYYIPADIFITNPLNTYITLRKIISDCITSKGLKIGWSFVDNISVPNLTLTNIDSYNNRSVLHNSTDLLSKINLSLIHNNHNDSDIDISIVIPNYNNGRYINDALQSIHYQNLCKCGKMKWEIVILDDGSTDDSVNVLKKINLTWCPNIKIIVRTDNNKGIGLTSRQLVALSSGKWIATLDPDDALMPKCLNVICQKIVHLGEKYSNSSMVYSNFWYYDQTLTTRYGRGYCRALKSGENNIDINCVSHIRIINRKYYYLTTGYSTVLPVAIDKDIIYKCEEVGKLSYINDMLYKYRKNPKSLTCDKYRNEHKKYFAEIVSMAKKRRQCKKYKDEISKIIKRL